MSISAVACACWDFLAFTRAIAAATAALRGSVSTSAWASAGVSISAVACACWAFLAFTRAIAAATAALRGSVSTSAGVSAGVSTFAVACACWDFLAFTRAIAAATVALRGSLSASAVVWVFCGTCCANLAACFARASSLRFLRAAIAAALSGCSPALTAIILPMLCFSFTRESADCTSFCWWSSSLTAARWCLTSRSSFSRSIRIFFASKRALASAARLASASISRISAFSWR